MLFSNSILNLVKPTLCLKVDQEKPLPLPAIHHLGEHIATESIQKKISYQHILEVFSNASLHRAPFHGATWAIIRNFGWSIPEKLNKFVEEEICNFKQIPRILDLWIDCK
jgi:hypothetical protein